VDGPYTCAIEWWINWQYIGDDDDVRNIQTRAIASLTKAAWQDDYFWKGPTLGLYAKRRQWHAQDADGNPWNHQGYQVDEWYVTNPQDNSCNVVNIKTGAFHTDRLGSFPDDYSMGSGDQPIAWCSINGG
jgi:hypothetical protein